jgi:hypothetical protein
MKQRMNYEVHAANLCKTTCQVICPTAIQNSELPRLDTFMSYSIVYSKAIAILYLHMLCLHIFLESQDVGDDYSTLQKYAHIHSIPR